MKGLRTMSRGLRTLLLTSVLAGSSAVAQISPMGNVPRPAPTQQPKAAAPAQRPAKTAPDALAPNNPDFKAEQTAAQPVPVPPPLPPAVWDVINAQQLLQYIAGIGKEGLNPADYDPEGLQQAIQSGNILANPARDRHDNRLHRRLIQPSSKRQTDASVLHPPHL